jgi:hypothetical protein
LIETIVEEYGGKQAELERRAGGEPLVDLPGAEVLFVRVGPHEIEVKLVEGSLGQEVGAVGERFQVEELVFDEAMDGFDVGLIGVAAGEMRWCLAQNSILRAGRSGWCMNAGGLGTASVPRAFPARRHSESVG